MFNSFTLSVFLQTANGQRQSRENEKQLKQRQVNNETDGGPGCAAPPVNPLQNGSCSVQTPDTRVWRHLPGAAQIMRVPVRNLRGDAGGGAGLVVQQINKSPAVMRTLSK